MWCASRGVYDGLMEVEEEVEEALFGQWMDGWMDGYVYAADGNGMEML